MDQIPIKFQLLTRDELAQAIFLSLVKQGVTGAIVGLSYSLADKMIAMRESPTHEDLCSIEQLEFERLKSNCSSGIKDIINKLKLSL